MILPENSDPEMTCGVSTASKADGSSNETHSSSYRNPSIIEDQDTYNLLGMIRELVEETNDWDDSLFLDNNFRLMIEQSQNLSFILNDCGSLQGPTTSEFGHKSVHFDETQVVTRTCDLEPNTTPSGGGQLISFLEDDSKDEDNIGVAH
ncbi:hypothetical protein AX17_001137 [Amanita inopinata Kibby_2008]|nr:hypothetical protein AX17_001137 [Amanita inopinata Kibby_2008]